MDDIIPSAAAEPETLTVGPLPSAAYLIGVYRDKAAKEPGQEHLDELQELVRSYGGHVVGRLLIPLREVNPRTFLGSGKVEELVPLINVSGAQVLIFDAELTPSQQRNLESTLKVTVADRTEVILSVFARHARTKEARLQVELAQIQHHMPRLKRLWTHLSRQRGGGVNQKGEGETQIEIDRRLMKRRLEQVKKEIEQVQLTRTTKQKARQRSSIVSFAIIGYTNAGKSTLMNRWSDAGVLVEDKLFATLDTTTRRFKLPSGVEVLLVDTVGFIRKLPHLLVAAFSSTLQEALSADILLHLIDGSHPQVEAHLQATEQVLQQLGMDAKERLKVFSKADLLSSEQRTELMSLVKEGCFISALTGEGLERLTALMQACVDKGHHGVALLLPHDRSDLLNQLYRLGYVLKVTYLDRGICVYANLPEQGRETWSLYELEDSGDLTSCHQ